MREARIELQRSRKVASILNYPIDDYYYSVDYMFKSSTYNDLAVGCGIIFLY